MRFIALLLLVLPVSVYAHTFGFSHETTVNGYQVDIGYSTAAPTPEESIIFDFNLPAIHQDVEYSNVWVRINKEDGSVVFAGGVHNSTFGGPRVSYVFPEEGTYTVNARYENGSTILLETSFPITVVPESSYPLIPNVPGIVLGLIVGAGAIVLFKNLNSDKTLNRRKGVVEHLTLFNIYLREK